MKRKEVLEICKLFTPAECALTRIVGWIVDDDKNCIHEIDAPFLCLPEEIMFKLFEIFRKGLSGKVRKNLYDLEFAESKIGKDILYTLCSSKLKDENAYQLFMESITENYEHKGRFAIFIVHGMYDIPGKASDGTEMQDASDEVYEYIMTCICPVVLQHPGISFDEEGIKTAERQWIVKMTETAFVYPAFNEREEDYDHVWFYTKKADEPDEGLIESVLGCKMPVTPKMQKETLLEMINSETFSTYGMERAKEIYHDIQSLALDSELGTPVTKKQIEKILGIQGTEEDEEITLQNIINLKRFDVVMADASITVAADRTDLIEERKIDGENYILVRKNGTVAANGILLAEEGENNVK